MFNYPLVTVITATYNNFTYFEETVKSVLSQNYPNIEYIITDDCSSNFSYEKVNNIILKYKNNNLKRYEIISQKVNVGTVKNLNSALRNASGEYIIFVSSEDMFKSQDTIKQIIDVAITKNSTVLSYSREEYDDRKIIRTIPYKSLHNKLYKLNNPKKQYRALVTCKYYDLASGSSICIKTDFLKKIGYFDEQYKYWEDGPFLAKCNSEGITIDQAYEICGLLYKAGGISSNKKTKLSKARIGLNKDAQLFYENVLKENNSFLNIYDKRIIKYHIEKLNNQTILEEALLMIQYFDVVLVNQINKCITKYASYNDKRKR